MENLEKSSTFKMFISRPGKVIVKNVIPKVLEKVMEISYIHMFIYTVYTVCFEFSL